MAEAENTPERQRKKQRPETPQSLHLASLAACRQRQQLPLLPSSSLVFQIADRRAHAWASCTKSRVRPKRLQAEQLSKVTIALETKMMEADLRYYQRKRDAEFQLYEREQEAHGRTTETALYAAGSRR
ncbi:hypothetical protein EJ110_NYTH11306 [Nymphaea thermarum]|nr:hypothetical protein EJ110_NYTH11306 [Nymphaea thermarum]